MWAFCKVSTANDLLNQAASCILLWWLLHVSHSDHLVSVWGVSRSFSWDNSIWAGELLKLTFCWFNLRQAYKEFGHTPFSRVLGSFKMWKYYFIKNNTSCIVFIVWANTNLKALKLNKKMKTFLFYFVHPQSVFRFPVFQGFLVV